MCTKSLSFDEYLFLESISFFSLIAQIGNTAERPYTGMRTVNCNPNVEKFIAQYTIFAAIENIPYVKSSRATESSILHDWCGLGVVM